MSTAALVALGVAMAVAAVIGLSLLVGRLSARPRGQRQECRPVRSERDTDAKETKRYVIAPVIVIGNRIER